MLATHPPNPKNLPTNPRRYALDQVKSRVISGTEEGVFGWISVNYLAGRLRGMRDEAKGTLTALEVGGASFQITFRQKTAPAADHGLFHVKVKASLL